MNPISLHAVRSLLRGKILIYVSLDNSFESDRMIRMRDLRAYGLFYFSLFKHLWGKGRKGGMRRKKWDKGRSERRNERGGGEKGKLLESYMIWNFMKI